MVGGNWLFLVVCMLALEGFFSMQEVAMLSYDPLLLNYELRLGRFTAKWIHYFLRSPQVLFTATLFMVEFSLHFGSECSRRFFSERNWPTGIVSIFYIPIVVLFGELVPLFFGMRFAHRIARWGVFLLLPLQLLIGPVFCLFRKVTFAITRFFGWYSRKVENSLLCREDVLLALHEDQQFVKVISTLGNGGTVSHAFSWVRKLYVKDCVMPLSSLPSLYGEKYSLEDLWKCLVEIDAPFVQCISEGQLPRFAFPCHLVRSSKSTCVHFKELEESPLLFGDASMLSCLPFLQEVDWKDQVFLVCTKSQKLLGWISTKIICNCFLPGLGAFPEEHIPCFLHKIISVSTTLQCLNCQLGMKLGEEDEKEKTLYSLLTEVLHRPPRLGDSCSVRGVDIIVIHAKPFKGDLMVLLRYSKKTIF